MSATPCAMCRAIFNASTDSPRRRYDLHLMEYNHFVVLPALGPLTVGHVMVVSRSHTANLLSLGKSERDEYIEIVNRIRQILVYSDEGILEAEHGSYGISSGGSCIDHAHINLIPRAAMHLRMFDGELPIIHTGVDIKGIKAPQESYILLRSQNDFVLYRAADVPSQLIRRKLCFIEGRDDWDWAACQGLDIVEKTIDIYTGVSHG